MHNRPTQARVRVLAHLALSACLGPCAALAADRATGADARSRYLHERALCESGQSHQDRATCLREAGAAYEQARQRGLEDGQAGQYERNALLRCNVLPPEDRNVCVARMRQGLAVGSVEAGGIYRELTIREIPPTN
jgi:hypothetical protein